MHCLIQCISQICIVDAISHNRRNNAGLFQWHSSTAFGWDAFLRDRMDVMAFDSRELHGHPSTLRTSLYLFILDMFFNLHLRDLKNGVCLSGGDRCTTFICIPNNSLVLSPGINCVHDVFFSNFSIKIFVAYLDTTVSYRLWNVGSSGIWKSLLCF